MPNKTADAAPMGAVLNLFYIASAATALGFGIKSLDLLFELNESRYVAIKYMSLPPVDVLYQQPMAGRRRTEKDARAKLMHDAALVRETSIINIPAQNVMKFACLGRSGCDCCGRRGRAPHKGLHAL